MLGKILKSRKKDETADEGNLMPVRYEVGGKEIHFDELPRPLRRTFEKHARTQRKRYEAYKDLVDSKGQRVAIVFSSPKALSLDVTVAIQIPEELKHQVKGAEKAERIA